MSRILVVSDDPRTIQLVSEATEGRLSVLPVTTPLSAEPMVSGPNADTLVVVLDIGPGRGGVALQVADELTNQHAVVSVVMDDEPDALGLAALRAGVRDVLTPDVDLPRLRQVLDASVQFAQALHFSQHGIPTHEPPPQTRPGGRVITIASPKGGVGKTAIATNLAVGLAQRLPGRVVIVDLDIHYGDVASALNLNPQYTLPDCVQGPARTDPMALKSLLTQHVTTLYVIAGSEDPGDASLVSAEDCARMLQMLAREFDFVVVDTAPGLGDHVLAALDQSSELVLVTGLDVPGVRGMVKELATLTDLNLLLDDRHLVVNFEDKFRGMTVKDVEHALGEEVDVVLPLSTAVPLSVNQGLPLVQSGSKDPVARQLLTLVNRIAPVAEPVKPKKSLFRLGAVR